MDGEPQLVQLVKCCKQKCSHILTDDFYDWLESEDGYGRTAHCPKCNGTEFYTLNHKGQQENHASKLDPTTIEPTNRMGNKLRTKLLTVRNMYI